jgi:hypothetical protein
VAVFLEFGIIIGGQHFAVRVNVDSGIFALFKQLFEIFQVVA